MIIQNNLNSIKAHQNWINNNIHNIANANSNRFRPQDTTLINDKNGNFTAKTNKTSSNVSEKSQTGSTKKISEHSFLQKNIEADTKITRDKDDMFGTLLDTKA